MKGKRKPQTPAVVVCQQLFHELSVNFPFGHVCFKATLVRVETMSRCQEDRYVRRLAYTADENSSASRLQEFIGSICAPLTTA